MQTQLNPSRRIGIDLGGTKIEALVLDQRGREVFRKRVPTPRGSYAATLEAIAALVRDAGDGHGRRRHPRRDLPRHRAGEERQLHVPDRAAPSSRISSARSGARCASTNDANCFALSEAVDGAGAGAQVVFGVILGTGVGGGIVVRGEVLTGLNAIAGEWGHNPLPWPRAGGPAAAARATAAAAAASRPISRDPRSRATTSSPPASASPPEEIARARRATRREATLARYEERLARALGSVINVLDPDVIVLGGGLSNLDAALRQRARGSGAATSSPIVVDTRLLPPRHGDASGVRGAAWLWGGPPRSG